MPVRAAPAIQRLAMIISVVLSLSAPVSAFAQPASATMGDFATGSEFESYLRVLQVAGIAPPYPFSIRGFSPREIRKLVSQDSTGPWSLKNRFRTTLFDAGPAYVITTYNSAFPYGANDGPVWAGKGLTVAASGAVSGSYGPLSYTFAPVVFRAQNAEFPLLDNAQPGNLHYNHGTFSGVIDLPQRFGPSAYQRVDLGESGVRVDTRFVTAGFATGNQWIGPATEYPFLLSNNAPGFPHLFAGTGEPVNLWLAKVHARVMWGMLYQSDYGPVTGGTRFTGDETGTERLTTSLNIVVQPRGIPGLEMGVARYFHVPFQNGEPSLKFWTKPFKVLFLKNEYAQGDSAGYDNQLASLFFRWVFPASGFEIYGERGYEDQFYDMRDFVQDIDHEREYSLGFQKTIRTRPSRIDVVKGELVNYQVPTLGRVRIEDAVYLHSPLRQGHTNRGQLLGASPGVAAAAASTVSWTRYSPAGRTAVTFHRIVRDQVGNYLDKLLHYGDYNSFPGLASVPPDMRTDVIVAMGVERMQFTRFVDFGAKLEAMENYNRNFSSNVKNLNLQIMGRVRAW
jgi:hypothetical protein